MENNIEFDLMPLLSVFKIKPKNKDLYLEAFTHSSMNILSKDIIDYQRLEFVGDTVLSTIIATISYKVRPDLHEGELTKLRSSLVDTKNLSKIALSYHFDEYIKVGQSFTQNLKESHSILEDVFEAFIGATYLDLGFPFVYRMVDKIFHRDIQIFNYEVSKDYKSKIQEVFQAEKHTDLVYKLLSRTGKANNPTFTVGLYYEGVCLGKGSGSSKKEAEQEAAKIALTKAARGNKK